MGKQICWLSNYDYPGLVSALNDLGWDVLSGPGRNCYAWAHGHDQSGVTKATPQEFSAFFRREIKTHEPQLVVIGKGFESNVESPTTAPDFWHILPDDLEFARKRGAVIVYLTLDDPNDFGFFSRTALGDKCDAIGTCCIDTKDAYKSLTAAKVFEWWPAWDERKIVKRVKYRCQLAIVGSPYMSPIDRDDGNPSGPSISRRDVALAAIKAGFKIKIWGPENWLDPNQGGDPALKTVYQGRCPLDEQFNVYATADVSYNSFVRYARRYANDRIFHIMGAGGCMLAESQLMMRASFPEAEWHRRGDTDDFVARLTGLIENPKARKRRAAEGRKRILDLHTYESRARAIHAEYLAARSRRKGDQ